MAFVMAAYLVKVAGQTLGRIGARMEVALQGYAGYEGESKIRGVFCFRHKKGAARAPK